MQEWDIKRPLNSFTYLILLTSVTFNIFIFCYIGEILANQVFPFIIFRRFLNMIRLDLIRLKSLCVKYIYKNDSNRNRKFKRHQKLTQNVLNTNCKNVVTDCQSWRKILHDRLVPDTGKKKSRPCVDNYDV